MDHRPDEVSLKQRWKRLVEEPKADKREAWFYPHEGGDRTISKGESKGLTGHHKELASIEFGIAQRDSTDPKFKANATAALALVPPTKYCLRSLDRQAIIPDKRLINRPNPSLWDSYNSQQIYLTAPMDREPSNGPGLSAAAAIPDLHHYNGRGGRVFALWKNAAATEPNISPAVVALLSKAFGGGGRSGRYLCLCRGAACPSGLHRQLRRRPCPPRSARAADCRCGALRRSRQAGPRSDPAAHLRGTLGRRRPAPSAARWLRRPDPAQGRRNPLHARGFSRHARIRCHQAPTARRHRLYRQCPVRRLGL